MKIIKLVLAFLALLWCSILLLWGTGFFYFLHITSNISNDNRNVTDAIVIFGGSQQNLYSGVQLLKLGYAPLAFITGHKPSEEYQNFLKTQHVSPEQFIFDKSIASNKSNHAMDAMIFLKKYQFNSMRLVVKSYQLPRAMLEIKSKISPDIIVIPHPISQKQANYTLIFEEYTQYILVLMASFIGKEDELNLSS